MKTRRKSLVGFLALLAGFILLACGLFVVLQPNKFEAAVRIRISQSPEGDTFGHPYFIFTEFATIQCQAVLDKVIASQNLAEKWGRKYNGEQRLSEAEAEKMIRRKLELSVVSGKPILVIKVLDDDPAEAAGLANSIAETYREIKTEQLRKIIAAGVESLKKQLDDQDAKVAALRNKLEQEKRDLNIADELTASNQPAAAPYFATRKELETAQRWRDDLKQRLDGIPIGAPAAEVEIIDSAAVSSKPIRPNRPLGIAMLIAGLALTVVGISFLREPQTNAARA